MYTYALLNFRISRKKALIDEPANLQSFPDVQNKNPKPVKFE